MPINFCYVIEGLLAGMERPGSHSALEEDLEFLRKQGIGAIVSLTEMPLEPDLLERFGFRRLHLPVADFEPPTLEQVDRFIEYLRLAESEKTAVVVHCGAGRGRTGTILACALVHRGAKAEEAIERLRALRPNSVETWEQEIFVREYEAHTLRRKDPDGEKGPQDLRASSDRE